MKCIKEDTVNEFIINKSRFITVLCKVNDVSLVKDIIDKYRNVYKDASHYCYAYVIDNLKKASDDGEPSGTAGVPILDVLQLKDLNYVLCIVIRYFGGIKLGAGGLIRAYRKSCIDCVNVSNLVELTDGYHVVFEVSYDKQNEVESIICNYSKKYDLSVVYDAYCSTQTFDILSKYNIISFNKCLIEKGN